MIEHVDIEGRLYPAIKLRNGKYLICGNQKPPKEEGVLNESDGKYLIYVMIENGTCGIINRIEKVTESHVLICTANKEECQMINNTEDIDEISRTSKKEYRIEDIIDVNSYIGYDDNNDNRTITDVDLKIIIIDDKCYKVIYKEKNTVIIKSYEDKIS